jgi:hypothetical protein
MAGVGAELAKVLGPEITKFADKATEIIGKIKEWAGAHPELVSMLKVLVAVLIGGGGLLLALSQISKAIIAINAALAIFHALSGPAGWIKLAAGMAIAGGAIYGISKLMGSTGSGITTGGSVVTSSGSGVYRPPTREEAQLGITGFQHGGIVTRPTMGIVAEAGPEAVVPLGKSGIGDTYIFNITAQGSIIAEEDLANTVYEKFLQRKARNVTLELA